MKKPCFMGIMGAALFCTGALAQKTVTVDLTRIDSVFGMESSLKDSFVRGVMGTHQDTPLDDIKSYGTTVAKTPWYGTVTLGEPGSAAHTYAYVLDKAKPTDTGYNRLILDLNRDKDLSNDKPLVPLVKQPKGSALSYSGLRWQACFQSIEVSLPFGDSSRPLRLIPRVYVTESDYVALNFVTPHAWQGKLRIEGEDYTVLLGHNYLVTGWFDAPDTGLHLIPDGGGSPARWWGADRLKAMHVINGTTYQFSATASGDRLTVSPYTGPFGEFRIGPGERAVDRMVISGALSALDKGVAVGRDLDRDRPSSAASCRVPVGDYLPNYINVEYGSLRIFLSDNYHADGKPRGRVLQRVHGIRIREDTAFVFDFSNTPEVLFASPARDLVLAPGDELSVKAVLIDPKLDFMIRRLSDTKLGALTPIVKILRANGEKLAEGTLPFG